MADRRKEIANGLDQLIKSGEIIWLSELIRAKPEADRKELEEQLRETEKLARKAGKKQKGKSKSKKEPSAQAKAENRIQTILKEVKEGNFGSSYQRWYSEALPAIEQLLPDRYEEFRELFRLDREPKELTVTTHTIKNYIHGTRVTRMYGEEDVFDATSVAMTKFKDQIDILASAQSRLDSVLADIEGTLEATLLDDELDTASGLLKAKHLRSAGIVAGVVLERHLKTILTNHQVTLRKKTQIGNLNDALKQAGIYDVPRWREIQRFGDIRNLCGHDGKREPTSEEVQELIAGTERVVATLF